MNKVYRFNVYRDARGEWRWKLKARNGLIVADSGEGYKTRTGAEHAVERIQAATLLFVR